MVSATTRTTSNRASVSLIAPPGREVGWVGSLAAQAKVRFVAGAGFIPDDFFNRFFFHKARPGGFILPTPLFFFFENTLNSAIPRGAFVFFLAPHPAAPRHAE